MYIVGIMVTNYIIRVKVHQPSGPTIPVYLNGLFTEPCYDIFIIIIMLQQCGEHLMGEMKNVFNRYYFGEDAK